MEIIEKTMHDIVRVIRNNGRYKTVAGTLLFIGGGGQADHGSPRRSSEEHLCMLSTDQFSMRSMR